MLPPESLNGITTFVVAARAQSFTEAAERLGVSKSAVGKAIARLEARLGVQLFHRTTRSLALSADGEAYFAACSAALDDIVAAEAALDSRSCRPSGRLRIDVPIAFGRRVVLPILLRLGKEYPELQFTLSFTDHLIDPIEEGIDLAIRFGDPKDSAGLVARRLTAFRWVICASPSYLAAHGTPRTLRDVHHHQGIVGFRPGPPLSWRVSDGTESYRLTPPATYEIGDGDAMIDATLAGFGLCQMPLPLVREHIDAGSLKTVLDEFTLDFVDVHAVWPKSAHLRPKVRRVVDMLVDLGSSGGLA